MKPKTKTQNLLLWLAAFLLAVLLSFLAALASQLPGDTPINWREVALDVINTIVSIAPVVAAGLGLPRLGGEIRANLVDEIGKEKATIVLEQMAETGRAPNIDYGMLADEILKRRYVQQQNR